MAENHYNWPYWLNKNEFEMDVYLVENKVYLVIGGYNYEGDNGEHSEIALTREKAEEILAKWKAEGRYDFAEIYEKTIED